MDPTDEVRPPQILFAGYAPVHFLCFLPVYEKLQGDPSIDLWLSGGFRRKDEAGAETYDIAGFYDPFPVARDRILPFDEAREREFDVAVCAHTSDRLLPRRAGRTIQIFHGVSFKNFAVREKVLRYDLICVPGRYHAERFRELGLIRPGGSTLLLTGFPKVDRMVRSDLDRDGLLRSMGLDPDKPTILYAPTGGKNNSLETVGEEVISAIGADSRWNLLVKPHDHPKRKIDWFARLAAHESDRVRLVRGLDVIDFLVVADLLVTDASSVAVEYTLLDRPIVFIDVPELLQNAVDRGAPVDLTTYGRRIGKLARTPGEVVAAVETGLAEPVAESALRREMSRHVFHDPGGAADRVARVVRHAAGLEEKLPADVEVLEAETTISRPSGHNIEAVSEPVRTERTGGEKRSRRRAEALRLLLRTARPHRVALVYGTLATLGVVAMRLALPWPLRGIVENVFPNATGGSGQLASSLGGNPVLVFCGMYLVLSIGTGAFEWIQRVWMARVAGRTAHDLRTLAVSSLGPSEGRSARGTADLITRVVGDVARIRADLKGILIHLGQNGLLLLVITLLFLYIAPKLGVLFLVSGLFAILIGYRAVDKVAKTASKHRRKESEYAAAIQVDEEEDDEPDAPAISRSSTRKDVRTTRIIGRSTLLVHTTVAATISLALWIGVGDVRAGALAPGELFLFIAYAITIQRRAVMIGRQIARGGKLFANTDRLAVLIERSAETPEAPRSLVTSIRLEGIRVRRFPTQSRRARLGPVDLTVHRGEHVAVLGGDGAGKSSLLAVLGGRLEARRGRLWWDADDVTNATGVLRASVAYVSDEPHFGRITVRRLLGVPEGEPSKHQLEVLETLGSWRVVRRLQRGLEQRVPSSNLSPSERRALLLGGAVLGDAPVWVLDNPVDTDRSRDQTRLATILEHARDRTTIVALRRPVSVELFSRVIVLRQGKVFFDGSPAEWKAWRKQIREIRGA